MRGVSANCRDNHDTFVMENGWLCWYIGVLSVFDINKSVDL